MKDLLHAQQHTPRPLGPQGQQTRRDLENFLRRQSLAFARWARRRGLLRGRAARRLKLRPSTLGRWHRAWKADRLKVHPLGRPRQQASAIEKLEVNQCLQQAGPTVGLPALHCQFPTLARSQLADLQRTYRGQWFLDQQIQAECLAWLVPGTVWATDFSECPLPIDGYGRYLLAVRDLASHNQLLLLPSPHANAATAAAAMEHLFTLLGPPLVLKSDNGSPFIADDFRNLLIRWKVTPLLSPPYWPQYNGAIEAGFSASKTRIYLEAARHGRFDHWLADDVEAARHLANYASRPWGRLAPSPQERWDQRIPPSPEQRIAFVQSQADHDFKVRAELGLALIPDLDPKDRATVARESVGRALQGLGYVQVQRRPITPPFNLAIGAIIP